GGDAGDGDRGGVAARFPDTVRHRGGAAQAARHRVDRGDPRLIFKAHELRNREGGEDAQNDDDDDQLDEREAALRGTTHVLDSEKKGLEYSNMTIIIGVGATGRWQRSAKCDTGRGRLWEV